MTTPRVRARVALLAGLAAAAAAAAAWPPAGSLALRVALPFVSVAALGAGWLAPAVTTLLLAVLGPLAPEVPRLVGDGSAPPFLLAVALAACLGILARALADGDPSPVPAGVRRAAIGFLAVAAVSALSSAVRGETLFLLLRGRAEPLVVNALGMTADGRGRDALRLLLTFVLLYAALEVFARPARHPAGRRRLVLAAASGLLAAAACAFLPLPAPADDYWSKIGRAAGTFTDPNAFGVGLGLLLPLAGAALASEGTRGRWLGGAALLAGAVALERSGSRTGLLVAAGAAAVAVLGGLLAGGARRRVAMAGLAAGALAVALVVLLLPRGGAPAVGSLARRIGAVLAGGSAADLSSQRPLFWRAAAAEIAAEPASGCGLGGFPYVFPARMEAAGTPVSFTDSATNAFLDVASEAGLPALALALVAALPLLASGLASATSKGPVPEGARAAGAALFGLFLASFFGLHLRFPEVALLAALAAALLPPAAAPSDDEGTGPKRAVAVLAAAGALAAVVAALSTASPAAAFPRGPWVGAWLPEGARGEWRWLGERAFRRVLPGERSVRIVLKNDRPDGHPVAMAVDVDGTSVGTVEVPAWHEQAYRVGPLAEGAEAVGLRFSPTMVPREMNGSPDARRLSVQLLGGRGETR